MSPDPAPASASLSARLLYALRQKRLVDGLNGRMWDAGAHLLWEKQIQAIEHELGTASLDALSEAINCGEMMSSEAAKVLARRKDPLDPRDIEIGMLRQEIESREQSRLNAIRELQTQEWIEPKEQG